MNKDEHSILASYAKRGNLATQMGCSILLILGMVWLLDPIAGGIVGALIVVFQLIGWRRDRQQFVREELPRIDASLKDGRVLVKKVKANRVIELVEIEDEGEGYIYDVGDGKTLFLKGPNYYPRKKKPWPNSEFEIVRTANGEFILGIVCTGQELTPVERIPMADCTDEVILNDFEKLVDANIYDFAKSIKKHL